jgi:hypothetical protein
VRSDLPQPSHGLVKEDTLGGIFFLRLQTSHLHISLWNFVFDREIFFSIPRDRPKWVDRETSLQRNKETNSRF